MQQGSNEPQRLSARHRGWVRQGLLWSWELRRMWAAWVWWAASRKRWEGRDRLANEEMEGGCSEKGSVKCTDFIAGSRATGMMLKWQVGAWVTCMKVGTTNAYIISTDGAEEWVWEPQGRDRERKKYIILGIVLCGRVCVFGKKETTKEMASTGPEGRWCWISALCRSCELWNQKGPRGGIGFNSLRHPIDTASSTSVSFPFFLCKINGGNHTGRTTAKMQWAPATHLPTAGSQILSYCITEWHRLSYLLSSLWKPQKSEM